jgi:uncharacterized protein YraI
MKLGLRTLALIGAMLVGIALPATADAWYSRTEGAVSLRTGPGVNYKRIATIPAGARIWVDSCQPRWCRVAWHGLHGFVAASYVAGRLVERPPYYDGGYWWYYDGYHWWPRKPPHKPPHRPPHGPMPPKWEKRPH